VKKLLDTFKHAFAIENDDTFVLNEQQRDLVDRFCQQVVARRLTTVASLLVETCRPLHNLGAQTLHAFEPFVSSLINDKRDYDELTKMMEHRGFLDAFSDRLNHWEAQHEQRANSPTTGKKASHAE